MRLHFQEKPWDLYASVGYTMVMAGVLVVLGVGNLLAILFVLFVPGYVLVAAFFPRNNELDWTERIALSFGLGIAVVPLLGLLLNLTPWSIRFTPIVLSVALFTIGVGYIAYWRRMGLVLEERLSWTLDLALPAWKSYTLFDKALTIGLAASIVVAAVTLAYVVATSRPPEAFTEFHILGPGGNASGYPRSLNISEPATILIGLANHESATVNYSVRVDLVGVQIVRNATTGVNETLEVNRTTWSWFNVTLANGQNWTQPYTFHVNETGRWKVQFLLFKDGDFSSAYAELHLYVTVA